MYHVYTVHTHIHKDINKLYVYYTDTQFSHVHAHSSLKESGEIWLEAWNIHTEPERKTK